MILMARGGLEGGCATSDGKHPSPDSTTRHRRGAIIQVSSEQPGYRSSQEKERKVSAPRSPGETPPLYLRGQDHEKPNPLGFRQQPGGSAFKGVEASQQLLTRVKQVSKYQVEGGGARRDGRYDSGLGTLE